MHNSYVLCDFFLLFLGFIKISVNSIFNIRQDKACHWSWFTLFTFITWIVRVFLYILLLFHLLFFICFFFLYLLFLGYFGWRWRWSHFRHRFFHFRLIFLRAKESFYFRQNWRRLFLFWILNFANFIVKITTFLYGFFFITSLPFLVGWTSFPRLISWTLLAIRTQSFLFLNLFHITSRSFSLPFSSPSTITSCLVFDF